jgi:CHAT domain-containing protein
MRGLVFRTKTNRSHGFLLALALASDAPATAGVVVESAQAPPGALSPLAAGDELLRWRLVGSAPARSGELAHWGEFDQLPLVESPRGTLEIELARAGPPRIERLPPAAWSFKGRPAAASDELVAFVADLAAKESTAADVERRIAAEPADVRSWAWTRYAESRGRRSDWAGAAAAYAAAIALAPPAVAADLERFHGDALRRLNRYDDAEAAYRRALAIWNRIEPSGLGSSTALGALGGLAGAQYDLAEANRQYAEVARIRKRLVPGSWLHANALNNLGTLAGRRNDLAAAESYLLEALAIAEKGQGDLAPLLANLGIVARLRGDFERAEMYTRRAADLFRMAGKSRDVANQLMTLSNIFGDVGRLDDALAASDEALTSLEGQAPDRELLGSARANRARLHQLREDRAAADIDIAAARELLGFDRPRTSTEALVTSMQAEQAELRGDLAAAARFAEITLEARSRIQPDTSFEAQAASELGRIRDLQGRPAEAEALFRRSIEKLERQQSRIGGGDRGLVAFRGKYAGIYRVYQEFLLRQGKTGAAFELYERSRARALLALLSQRDLDLADSDLDPAIARRRNELGGEIDRAYLALAKLPADAASEAERETQRLALETLHAERERLSREARAASPRLAAIEAPPALTLAEIQSSLAADTLLLAFSLGPKSSTLFSLAADGGLAAHSIAASEKQIASDVVRWVELVSGSAPRRAELRTIERRLTSLLFEPVAGRLAKARRLLIVPDGALHALAFAALPDPRNPERRLLESLPVAHQLSASVHAELQRRNVAIPATRIAVFADPVSSEGAAARYRRDFGRLPATRREAEKVREIFGAKARLFVDAAATEEAARREIPAASLVHFATHAVVDEALPLDSALLLSPEPGADDSQEGLLQAWEIAEQVKLSSQLVVLSACETARGAERGGEGILGLVRALQVAGAESVVASLWRVDDDSAAELMARFYRGLAAGRPRDEALRQAQLELLRGPVRIERDGRTIELRTSDPRHWAPFVLVGPAG